MRKSASLLLVVAISTAGVLVFRAVLDHFDRQRSEHEAEHLLNVWLRRFQHPSSCAGQLTGHFETPATGLPWERSPVVLCAGPRVQLRSGGGQNVRSSTFRRSTDPLFVRDVTHGAQNYQVAAFENAQAVRRRAKLSLFGVLLGPVFLGAQVWGRRQRQIVQLESEKEQLAETLCDLEDVQRTLQAMLDYRNQERNLMANEIHDGFMQEVTSARMFLEGLAARLPEDDIVANEQLANALQLVDSAVGEGRHLVSRLKPLVLHQDGLIPALQRLVANQEKRHGLSVAFRYPPGLGEAPIPPNLRHTLYRTAQEALANIRRHSGASEALIALQLDNGTVTLEIVDHGRGFQTSELQEDSFGLRGIRERARLDGGEAIVRSKPGEGTSVRVRLPIELKASRTTS